MLSSARVIRLRASQGVLLLLGTLALGTCTDGQDPAGPLGESHLRVALSSELVATLAPDEVRPIERIRIVAEEVPGGAILGVTTVDVDPGAQEWTLEVSLPVLVEATILATLSVELISLSTGQELVEWSGRTGSLSLRVGTRTEVQDIPLVKGPLANLAVTGLTIQEPLAPIREGESTQLAAVATTTTSQDPPTIFWRSLNPGVATVSGAGLVEGTAPGLALIVATAGAHADTVAVRVLPRPATVSLDPEGAVLDALGQEVVFQAQVLDPRGEPIPQEGVSWAVADPDVLQDLGGGGFRAQSRGTTLVRATSILDPSISGSAEVIVRQTVAAVQMLPEEALVFFGESTRFEAVALDANGFPVVGMGFTWTTSDEGVAVVDATGLVTGVDVGTVMVMAEALSGVVGVAEGGSPAPTPGTTGLATLVVLPPVATIVITPESARFRSLGETQQFLAEALDETGSPIPGLSFQWFSSDESVLVVDQDGIATALQNGGVVLEATVGGVTGYATVVVDQEVSSVEVSPDPWTFIEIATDVYQPRTFVARGYDGLGNRIPGVAFSWATGNGECFPIDDATSTQATVSAQCGCGWASEIYATSGGVTGEASVRTPSCGMATPVCRNLLLPPGSPFRLGVYNR